ncbi:hypothetical protein IG631_03055 [Alternaria alternata]|nr:hypothetical protein IG631_03055 [Alternaria alternata]
MASILSPLVSGSFVSFQSVSQWKAAMANSDQTSIVSLHCTRSTVIHGSSYGAQLGGMNGPRLRSSIKSTRCMRRCRQKAARAITRNHQTQPRSEQWGRNALRNFTLLIPVCR